MIQISIFYLSQRNDRRLTMSKGTAVRVKTFPDLSLFKRKKRLNKFKKLLLPSTLSRPTKLRQCLVLSTHRATFCSHVGYM